MTSSKARSVPHVTVCICTFRRPELVIRLLTRLEDQQTDGGFTYSVVVADNDDGRSAEQPVGAFAATSGYPVVYCAEPRQNIALARNMALAHARGEFIAFIDDDEFPVSEWLWNLVKVQREYDVAAILGPVRPHFEVEPPSWITKGGFFNRPEHPTGYDVPWAEARSGNVLFKREIVDGLEIAFRSQFDTAGEDVDFFRRMAEKGHRFVWCSEAVAYETVPPSRCTRNYLLRRAVLRGSNFPKHPTDRVTNITKSVIAVPCYTLALPVLAILGHHIFLRYLIKLLDHASRLCAFLGWSLVTQRQT